MRRHQQAAANYNGLNQTCQAPANGPFSCSVLVACPHSPCHQLGQPASGCSPASDPVRPAVATRADLTQLLKPESQKESHKAAHEAFKEARILGPPISYWRLTSRAIASQLGAILVTRLLLCELGKNIPFSPA